MAAQDPDLRSRNLVASTSRTLPVSGLPRDPQDILEIISVVLSKALEAILFELSDLRGAWDGGTGSSKLTADSKKLLSLANRMAMRGAGRSGDLTRVTVSHLSAVAEEIAALRDSILTTPPGRDHGALTGLTPDDDHPHYHTDARGDARYYTQTELNGVNGATLIGHHLAIGGGSVDTVYNMLNHIIPHWMIEGGVVSDEGGLNIQWTAGGVYSSLTDAVAYFDARGTDLALTDDATNFLYYDGTTTLQVKTTELAADEIEIAHAHCANGEIFELHQEEGVNDAVTGILRGLAQVIPVIVTTGLVVSEDVDVTNPLDVNQSSGTYYRDMHDAVDVAAIDSRTSPMRRWHKDGGGTDFTYDTDAEIDTAQYDNAGTLANIPSNKWVRSVFFTDGTYIHWIYAIEYFNTLAGALNAADPPMPTGLLGLPKTTALIYQEGDAILPTAGGDQWIDVRPIIGAAGSNAVVSDHGSLGGVSSDQHHTESHTIASHSDVDFSGTKGFLTKTGAGAYGLQLRETSITMLALAAEEAF